MRRSLVVPRYVSPSSRDQHHLVDDLPRALLERLSYIWLDTTTNEYLLVFANPAGGSTNVTVPRAELKAPETVARICLEAP